MAIKKVLIANRGEIAVRIIKTLNKMGLGSVAVFHAVDEKSLAVGMADETFELTGDLPVAAYLDMEQIILAAKHAGADAVHPGFGFLSENATFAARLQEEGITFIGPNTANIDLMGNKIRARAFCLKHGFPFAPSVIDEGDEEKFIASAKEIGAPLLIKAAAGGGGKGMQIVRDIDEIVDAIDLARSEAQRSFGDNTVYIERLIERPRHIEVQVLADHHGNIVHLGERECSIQRRFQKVIEEAPSPELDPDKRDEICAAAVVIAQAANYTNAGTVEFIFAPDGTYYFLEMNTRLQVEHPVTEMITGIDLVEQQIHIADNRKLEFAQDDIKFDGHAIEVRLYAEDPENDFAPATGLLLVYDLGEGIARVENGFVQGQQVTSAFDPMMAKLIAHGTTRELAISNAIEALNQSTIFGVQTNRDFLIKILEHDSFFSGDTNTAFIEEHAADLLPVPLTGEQVTLLLAAAALTTRAFNNEALRPPNLHTRIGGWQN
jgi:acetyl/propionyl-CoA carboxylase alpha subunit